MHPSYPFLSDIPADVHNIVFDLGGVLLNYDTHRDARALRAIGLPEYAEWPRTPGLSDLIEDYYAGLLSDPDFCRRLRPFLLPAAQPLPAAAVPSRLSSSSSPSLPGVQGLGSATAGRLSTPAPPSPSDAALLAALQAVYADLPPERLRALLSLRQRYRVFLLSNINPRGWQHALRQFARAGIPVTACFDGVFLSFEMGMRKPAPAVYQRVAREAGFLPHSALLLDDSPENLRGAAAAGWQTRLVK